MNNFSLKTKMAVAVSTLFICFVVILTHFILSYLEREFKKTISDQQFTLASSLANNIDGDLTLLQNALIAGASRLPRQIITDSERAQSFLDGESGLLSIFDNAIFLISKEGRLIAESPYLPNGRDRDVSYREYFQMTQTLKQPYISKPYIAVHTPGAPAIMVTAPVFDRAGNVLAILGGSFNLHGSNILSRMRSINIGKTGYVFLISSDRTMIVQPGQYDFLKSNSIPPGLNTLLDKALSGSSVSDETIALNGERVLASYKRLQATDWLLAVHYPLDEAYAPFEKIRRYVTVGIIAGTIIVLSLVWIVMRRLTQPLTLIAKHMEEYPEKPVKLKIMEIASSDEIETLATAFNKMIHELDKQENIHQKLHSQLLQSQKMESIGRLAGGVAHDFNNMLTAIIGFGGLLQMKLDKDSHLRGYLDQMLSAAEKAANLSQGLLAFSRKQVLDTKPVNLTAIVTNMNKILSRVIGDDIEFKTVLNGESLVTMADSSQIEQVLLNLATNARDAMPNGGELIIEIGFAEMDADYVEAHGFGEPGKYVLISVTDTGTGIDEITKQNMFEPFYTTKGVGSGTGLGLSIVYGIVKQHNGFINVYSELGMGTTFRIYLPLIQTAICTTENSLVPVLTGGSETILIAEDEPQVRLFSKTTLETFGYRVIEAVDGEDALARFEEHKEEICLLLVDVLMPKRNGQDVYNEIKKLKPDIKVIFCSGHTGDVLIDKGLMKEGTSFIEKPMSPNLLAGRVREILDGSMNLARREL
jgi:signal transduction histidine kinase